MKKVDDYIATLPQWQQTNLTLFRNIVHDEIPSVVEDWKWNVPFFMVGGKMYFAASAFKKHTKFNFIHNGALLEDTDKLFNNGFESKKSRAIDLVEGKAIDEEKLRQLVRASVS